MSIEWAFLCPFLTMKPRLNSSDLFREHLLALLCASGFIGVFIVSVPIIYMLSLPTHTELLLFTALFALCHLANWPMLRVRWQLWFQGRLTPYAATCITALLAGSFGIPFILLINLLQ